MNVGKTAVGGVSNGLLTPPPPHPSLGTVAARLSHPCQVTIDQAASIYALYLILSPLTFCGAFETWQERDTASASRCLQIATLSIHPRGGDVFLFAAKHQGPHSPTSSTPLPIGDSAFPLTSDAMAEV